MKQRVTEHDAELLDRWVDGQLEADAAGSLRERLGGDAALRAEEAELRSLFAAFELGKVEVRDGFADSVMARLPRRARASRLAVALLVAAGLAGLAASLALLAGSGLPTGGSVVATLGDYAATLLLAGAGLIGASWRGVGEGVRAFLALSPANVAIAVGLSTAAALLLFALLRRRGAVAAARSRPGRPRE
jgi:anti-sigma factor RsiW